MSHLVPNNPEGGSKDVSEYTETERASALTQTTDAALQRIAQGKKIDKATATLIVDLADGTEKADSLPKEVTDAANATDKASKKSTDEA